MANHAFGNRPAAAIGAMRHRLTLEAPVEQPDGAGGREQVFSPIAQLWASVESLSGIVRRLGDRPEHAASHRVTMRWRADIDAAKRLRLGVRIFIIHAVADADAHRRRLVCLVEEVTP